MLRENGLGDYVNKAIKSLSKGMAQTSAAVRHHRPSAQADRARRAVLRPGPDQPGAAGAPDPRGSGFGDDHHLLDPRHLACRAPVRARRHHCGWPHPLRRAGVGSARSAAPAGSAEDQGGGRRLAHGAPERRPIERKACGSSSFPGGESSRCSRRSSPAAPVSRNCRSNGRVFMTHSSPSRAKRLRSRWKRASARNWGAAA
jgi:hypothetical protein